MAKFTGTLTGGTTVKRNLRALMVAASGRAMKTAVTAGAIPMQNRWKELAAHETGTYKRSVHIGGITRPEGGGDDSHVKAREAVTEPDIGPAHVVVTIGTDIVDPPYPWFLEDGTVHMAAHPAAQPAFDETKDAAQAEIAAVLRIQFQAAVKL